MNTFTHEQAYRGEDLLKKIASQHITLCGVGAVGSNLADNLIRQGFIHLTVIDKDRVEDHNRNTQVYGSRDVGQKKVAAIRNHLFNVLKVAVDPVDKELTEANVRKLLRKDTIVVDGFDNIESRKIVTDYCRDNDIPCLHIGLAEDAAEVTWNDQYRLPRSNAGLDVCEYPLARNTALMAVVVGTESIIRYIDTGEMENYLITLRDFKISRV